MIYKNGLYTNGSDIVFVNGEQRMPIVNLDWIFLGKFLECFDEFDLINAIHDYHFLGMAANELLKQDQTKDYVNWYIKRI